jgi:hypothetical protein
MEPLALALIVTLALVVLLRRPGVFSPALVAEGVGRAPARVVPGDEEEQLPETDRAPRPWLPWAVGALAMLRVVLLVALRA